MRQQNGRKKEGTLPKKEEIEFEKHEIILHAAIEKVKEYNRRLAERRGKKYCVNDQLLRHVLLVDINEGTDIVDTKVRLARRAANILVYMIKREPFCSLNSDTGVAVLFGYLKANEHPMALERGFDLLDVIEKYHKGSVGDIRNRVEKLIQQSISS